MEIVYCPFKLIKEAPDVVYRGRTCTEEKHCLYWTTRTSSGLVQLRHLLARATYRWADDAPGRDVTKRCVQVLLVD